jgi:hypothetical protein
MAFKWRRYKALLYRSLSGFSAFSVTWQKGNGTVLLRYELREKRSRAAQLVVLREGFEPEGVRGRSSPASSG